MDIFDTNFKEIFSSQIISIAGGLIAGSILLFFTDQILLIPGLFILLPGFLEVRGNISGTFASRLSSGLFLGVIKPNKYNTKLIRGNLIASFSLAVLISLVLGFLAFLLTFLIFKIFLFELILIALLAGILANIVEITLTLFATFYIFKKGHDPNNIMGPLLTSTGDVTSIVSLLIAILIII